MTTLAVAGTSAIVPLIEGHAATRERWTANLTAFSNDERLKADSTGTEGRPVTADFVFITTKSPGE